MINYVVDMIPSTLKHEKSNEIKNVVRFVESCTVNEKTFDFYRLM